MREKKKLTIADIAKQTGVSKATVSRILNGKPDVAPETRERVFRAMEEAQYVPSVFATQLNRGTSNLIGLLLPSLTWPWVLEVIRGVTEHLEHSDYEVILLTSTTPERTEKLFRKTVGSGFADGLIAILPPNTTSFIEDVYMSQFPLVVIDDREAHKTEFPSVVVDNVTAAYQATRYLLDRGHGMIGFIGGPAQLLCSQERYQGYIQALREADRSVHETLSIMSDFTQVGGYQAAKTLFSLPQRPSAVFAANDLMAFGVIDAAQEARLNVPGDFAVIGFDDIPQAQFCQPALTTVRQPMYEMGKAAAALLIAQIGGQIVREKRIKLDTQVIVRASA
jgi:LacI family transcriptional regulator